MIPRIRGKVGKAEDDKFYFELSIWSFDGETCLGEPWTIGPWESEAQAHQEMKRAVQISCEAIEKGLDGKTSGKYIDMKNGGVLRHFGDEQ